MRVLINALFLIPDRVGGSETYVRGLIHGLGENDSINQYILCLGPEASPTFTPPNARWRVVTSPIASSRRPVRLALEQSWIPAVAATLGTDVIHSTGYTAPLFSGQPRVTSIHDMNYKRHPEDLSVAERIVYTALIPSVARRSQRVLTLTESARQDLLHWTGALESRVTVIYPGVRKHWPGAPAADLPRLACHGVSQPFVVTVAASYPHKNLQRLVQAFLADLNAHPDVQLVIVGLRGRGHAAIAAASEHHPGAIKTLGWVEDALLASLYRCSLGLAFPSLYEGFGLPILEAMAMGTPVLTSAMGAMAEVANGACELVDPYDIDSIRRGLHRLIHDRQQAAVFRELGLQRAKQFSWDRAARRTLAVYETAAGVGGGKPTN